MNQDIEQFIEASFKESTQAIAFLSEHYGKEFDRLSIHEQSLVLMGYRAAAKLEASTEPSDEEIRALAEAHDAVVVCSGEGDYNDNYDAVIPFARALLAKYCGAGALPDEAKDAKNADALDARRYRQLWSITEFHRNPLYPVIDWFHDMPDITKADVDAALDEAHEIDSAAIEAQAKAGKP